MTAGFKNIINFLGSKKVLITEPLAPHTYFKIGGPADLFYTANNIEELKKAISASIKYKIPYFILGGGSNILVGDKGIRGLVIKNRADNISIRKFKGRVKDKQLQVDAADVYCESGVITNLLVRRTIQEGLQGLEYFLGIPGTIGGAIYNNSHFKKELIGNLVEQVDVLDSSGSQKSYNKKEMKFSYDYSILQETKEIVLSVTFRLKGGETKKLWEKAEEYAQQRTASQPLNYPNSGCIFKNIKPEECGFNTTKKGLISTGYLIDKAGLKGSKIGSAMVNQKHANFIVNTGGATAKDVLDLASLVQKKVKEKFNVSLKMEVFKVGEFN